MAPRVLTESERHTGRFDLPGAITGTLGLAALVYGLSSAATTANGVSHWGDTKVIASLAAAVVLLRLVPASSSRAASTRCCRCGSSANRDRSAANLIMLCVGTAMFGMFFFLTIFVQTVWGYSPLKTGVAYLPMVGMIMAHGRRQLPAGRAHRGQAAADRRLDSSRPAACSGCRGSPSTAPTRAACSARCW